ncbi:MAG: type IV pilus modification PilV family protein [Solirubrobacterales bacterium]
MRRLCRDESGVTIVEAMVAGLLLVIGGLATLQVFDASARNNFRAEESQVVVNRLQAELEELKAVPFAELAMNGNPGGSADENDPRWRVSGSDYALAKNGNNPRPMVIDPATGFDPGPEPFTTGDISGEIWRFVVWAPDPDCPDVNGCEDLKRLIVAATIDEAPISFERTFQEVQGDVANPEAFPPDNVNPPPDGDESAEAIFWLTDTPCTFSERQPIVPDPPESDGHPAHNTRARCVDGHQTGSTRGAPDLMFTEAPELDPELPPGDQPLFDYATDSEPENPIESDKGLLMPWATTDSCLLEPVLDIVDIRALLDDLLSPLLSAPDALDGVLDLVTGEPNKHLRAHTWLSPRVNSTGGILTGEGNLELWTKTINGAIHPGKICVYLFIRQTVQVPVKLLGLPLFYVTLEVDVPVVNSDFLADGGNPLNISYFEHAQDPWPSQWIEISMPLEFLSVDSTGAPIPLVLTPGSQVGMTLMVDKTGTEPGTGLEFMYDHPSFESRLHLETNEIISWGN